MTRNSNIPEGLHATSKRPSGSCAMIVSGGALALAGVMLLVNLHLQVNSLPATLEVPQPPITHQLHERMVEVDWNDVAGADRYQLQLWYPSGWIDLPDTDIGIDVAYDGSRAVVSKQSPGAMINTFRVRALGCGRASDWSDYGRKADAGSTNHDRDSLASAATVLAESQHDAIWSGILTTGTSGEVPGGYGYSRAASVGMLSPGTFILGRHEYQIVHASQATDGFVLELQHTNGTAPQFTLAVHDSNGKNPRELSTCNSVRIKTENGDRYLWLDSEVRWAAGAHSAMSISLANGHAHPAAGRVLRPVRPLTATFEHVPMQHSGSEFSLLVRFSHPIAAAADSLRSGSLQVNAGMVTSVQPLDGQRDLWQVNITPDSNRSVRVSLRSAAKCEMPGAICTQHQIRLANEPEAVVYGPPITARFIGGPEAHQGESQFPVRIQLSEPLLSTSQSLSRHLLSTSGARLTEVRRVDGRSDLWELIVAPESAVPVEIELNLDLECGSSAVSCLDDLFRIAEPRELIVPPAVIHLTFDDGPNPAYTPQILDILAWHGARATFFVTGESATLFPDLIARIVSEGHTLANHTWDHVALDTLSAEEFEDTVLRTQRVLGEHATACIRPPYYRADSETYARADQLGFRVIMGNVRPMDWTRPGAQVIADRIIGGAAHQAVVVLHDGGGDRSQTVEGLRMALAHLRSLNYSFEPICS